MRKVLHLRTSGQLLGAERVILETAKYLPQLGYHPVIGIPVEEHLPLPEFATTADALGYEVIEFPIKSAFDISAIKAIKKYVDSNQIDIIHSHGYREDFYATFARGKAKLIATNHLWKRTNLRLKLYATLDARLLKRFDAIIAVSHLIRDDMEERGISAEKITIVPNGVEVSNSSQPFSREAVRAEINIPLDSLVVGTLSSLTTEKGLHFALRAIAALKTTQNNLHMLIVGDGPELENLQSLSKRLGLQNSITFTGRRSDINTLLSTMDIFVLPSIIEGLPMALLEAMAAEKAVIASSVGDIPTVISKECGILVESANVEQLATAILTLANDEPARKNLGKNAKKRIEDHFSSLAMARSTAAIYNDVLNN